MAKGGKKDANRGDGQPQFILKDRLKGFGPSY
jgi:hypothetical protein